MIEVSTLWGIEKVKETKVCIKCGLEKAIGEFGVRSYGKQGNKREIRNDCKQCQGLQQKVVKELKKKHKDSMPCQDTACWGCGISPNERRANGQFLNRKNGWICEHDHETGEFRGWICDYCNTVIARAGENIDTLLRLAEGLRKGKFSDD